MQSVPDTGAATALELAQIRPERQGQRRLSELTRQERNLYRWILQRFATAVPPSGEATRATALELGLDPHEALAALTRDDLVHTDDDGQPVVAYPFSARDRGHRVLIDGLHEVEAMCAIDALGIAPMLGRPIEIRSRDPISGGEILVQLHPGATFALRAGVSTFDLSRYMGASLTMIDRHYGHLARDGRNHAINLLDGHASG